MNLTDREINLLRALSGAGWCRPMDLGGRDGSHHSHTLARLCRKGLVEREPRPTLTNALYAGTKAVGSWRYRITAAGEAMIA